MLRFLLLSSWYAKAPTTIGGLGCADQPALEALSLRVLCRGGEIGRRAGLKIPWANRPCGFEPRSRHFGINKGSQVRGGRGGASPLLSHGAGVCGGDVGQEAQEGSVCVP